MANKTKMYNLVKRYDSSIGKMKDYSFYKCCRRGRTYWLRGYKEYSLGSCAGCVYLFVDDQSFTIPFDVLREFDLVEVILTYVDI